jgi:hypothetical protein
MSSERPPFETLTPEQWAMLMIVLGAMWDRIDARLRAGGL